MNDLMALQQAIGSNPGDHAGRLALADYLDEAEHHSGACTQRLWVALDRIRSEPEEDSLRLEWAGIAERYSWLLDDRCMKARADLVRVQVDIGKQRRREFPASPENDQRQDWLEMREKAILDEWLYQFFLPPNAWWSLVVLEDMVWRRGWPSDLPNIEWESWVKDGDKILEDVPGLDLVEFHQEPRLEEVNRHNDGLSAVYHLEGIEGVHFSINRWKIQSVRNRSGLFNYARLFLLRKIWPGGKAMEVAGNGSDG